jgi:hypothetical protein
MASELRVNTLKDASGNNSIATSFVASGSAKAWANFNGTGTIAVNDSQNTSSAVDNGTGDYTQNFSSALANGYYSSTNMVAQANNDSAGSGNVDWMIYYSQTTTALRVTSGNGSATSADMYYVALTINGDLA